VARAVPLALDSALCDRCLLCVPACPSKAMRIGPGYISVDWDACTACGKCAGVCETGAIRLKGAPASVSGPAVHPSVADADPGPVKRTSEKAASAPPKPASPKSRPPATPEAPAPTRPTDGLSAGPHWTLPEAGLALLVAFALLVAVQALPGRIAGAPVWAGVVLLAYDVLLGVGLWYLAFRRKLDVDTAFRFDLLPRLSDMAYALAVALGCWLFSVSYRAIALGMGLTPPRGDGVDLTRVFGTGPVGIVATVAVVALLGPLLEEVLLRGVVLDAVGRRIGAWPAILVCAIAFALLHASVWSLLPLTVLGIGLGWLAVRSRSLVPAVLAHVLYNLIFVAAAFYAVR